MQCYVDLQWYFLWLKTQRPISICKYIHEHMISMNYIWIYFLMTVSFLHLNRMRVQWGVGGSLVKPLAGFIDHFFVADQHVSAGAYDEWQVLLRPA